MREKSSMLLSYNSLAVLRERDMKILVVSLGASRVAPMSECFHESTCTSTLAPATCVTNNYCGDGAALSLLSKQQCAGVERVVLRRVVRADSPPCASCIRRRGRAPRECWEEGVRHPQRTRFGLVLKRRNAFKRRV